MDDSKLSEPETLSAKIARIHETWGMTEEQLSKLAHVPLETLRAWIEPNLERDRSATVPAGMETAVPLVSIFDHLARKLPQVEDQVKWLMTPHPDFDQNRPLDIAASSIGNLQWLAYYLASSP